MIGSDILTKVEFEFVYSYTLAGVQKFKVIIDMETECSLFSWWILNWWIWMLSCYVHISVISEWYYFSARYGYLAKSSFTNLVPPSTILPQSHSHTSPPPLSSFISSKSPSHMHLICHCSHPPKKMHASLPTNCHLFVWSWIGPKRKLKYVVTLVKVCPQVIEFSAQLVMMPPLCPCAQFMLSNWVNKCLCHDNLSVPGIS